jgi:hypothetical protein
MFARKQVIIAVLMIITAIHACQSKQQKPKEPDTIPRKASPRQNNTQVPTLDKSPMDMSYYPVDYPILKMSGKVTGPPIARVIYSRPAKDGRVIFGNLIKYGEHWRLGANEATEIEFFTDVIIAGKKIKKGRYVLYCIPYQNKWVLELSNDLYVWGLKIHSAKDVASIEVPVSAANKNYEVFTMEFEPAGAGMQLVMSWDSVQAKLPIRY